MDYQLAPQWWGEIWKYATSHLGAAALSVLSFVIGVFSERIKKWYNERIDNRSNFVQQIKAIGYPCDKVKELHEELVPLIGEFMKTSPGDREGAALGQQCTLVLKNMLPHLRKIKSRLPERSIVFAVYKDQGLEDYYRLEQTVEDMEEFAGVDYKCFATMSPEERDRKLQLFKDFKENRLVQEGSPGLEAEQ